MVTLVLEMKVEIYYESKSGNGRIAMTKLGEVLSARGATVGVHHVSEAKPKELPQADLYVFSSPTRIGKPIGSMRRFAKKAKLPSGAKYAVVATYMEAQPDKKTGQMPTAEETAKFRRNIQMMDERLSGKGTKVADLSLMVKGMKGPLEDGWEAKLAAFADRLMGKA
jgi:flavodoxin